MQVPDVQGMPLQQSELAVQICPYSAHTLMTLVEPGLPATPDVLGAPAPPVVLGVPPAPPDPCAPPVPCSVMGVPQVPVVEPWGLTQTDPGQQSALIVQAPPRSTHFPLA